MADLFEDALSRVTVRDPATSANLGAGFDCLGLALSVHNLVEMAEIPGGLRVAVEGEGAGRLPAGPDNLAVRAAEHLFAAAGRRPRGLGLRLVNRIPPSRGLGSSSAAIVGALVAANELVGRPLGRDELLHLAVSLERHPDNVTPALFGGVTVAATVSGPASASSPEPTPAEERTVYVRFDPPAALALAVIVPDAPLSTEEARRALPPRVSRGDAVFNLQRACLLVAALQAGRLDLLPDALDDRLHQPYRGPLLPGLAEVLAGGRRPGLLGVTLSGSGSTVLAWLDHAAAGSGLDSSPRHGPSGRRVWSLWPACFGSAVWGAGCGS